jgi:hypothetical protein
VLPPPPAPRPQSPLHITPAPAAASVLPNQQLHVQAHSPDPEAAITIVIGILASSHIVGPANVDDNDILKSYLSTTPAAGGTRLIRSYSTRMRAIDLRDQYFSEQFQNGPLALLRISVGLLRNAPLSRSSSLIAYNRCSLAYRTPLLINRAQHDVPVPTFHSVCADNASPSQTDVATTFTSFVTLTQVLGRCLEYVYRVKSSTQEALETPSTEALELLLGNWKRDLKRQRALKRSAGNETRGPRRCESPLSLPSCEASPQTDTTRSGSWYAA